MIWTTPRLPHRTSSRWLSASFKPFRRDSVPSREHLEIA
jgi:hypothetical protein